MSLLNDFARPCVLMEKHREPDGAGGYGVTSVYSALVDKAVPIEYGDYFRDTETGTTYRVTSNPEEKQAPRSASFTLKYFTAERKELPA